MQAGHTQCAEVVCEVLSKKCEYKCSCMHSSVDPQNVSHYSLYVSSQHLTIKTFTHGNFTTSALSTQQLWSTTSPCTLS